MGIFGAIICFIMAGGIAWNILSFVSQVSLAGMTCYYLGDTAAVAATANCIHPGFYFGAWIIAAGFLIWGLVELFRPSHI
jgi:hypothetical protein